MCDQIYYVQYKSIIKYLNSHNDKMKFIHISTQCNT